MIQNRQDLCSFISEDMKLYPKLSNGGFSKLKIILVTNPINSQHQIYNYLICLRHAEYHHNNSFFSKKRGLIAAFHTFLCIFYNWRLKQISYKTGFQIPPNVIGKGLQIWHYGTIIINPNVQIGDNATLFPGVIIGANPNGVPVIGHHATILGGKNFWRNCDW